MVDLMDTLKSSFKTNPKFKPFISSIVFPNYKNIWPGEELVFDFPLTILIGKNGTNKSSVLHALYGCPEGKSVGEYWFSTHVDKVADADGKRSAFFYRYTIPETGDEAEVLKTAIRREIKHTKDKIDPDYWEPSRPVIEYGMRPMPPWEGRSSGNKGRLKTRWSAIEKAVLYLDFRAEISAFDKAFYKVDRTEARARHRLRLRKQSKPLRQIIDTKQTSFLYHTKERVFENCEFTKEQLITVGNILDTTYNRIVYIEHDFYLSGSFSIFLQKGDEKNYSEAWAGSGETSIIRLVYALDKAKPCSLILLDEPETSLHIEAQRQLRNYILNKIKEKNLQVVISTHSPYFADGLPDCAIKILNVEETSRKVKIINSAPADESSFYLGNKRNYLSKVNIWVEDVLSQAFAMFVCEKKLKASENDKISINPLSGGKGALLNFAAMEMLKKSSNVCFLFDGDQKPPSGIPDPSTIPESENSNLESIVSSIFGEIPKLPLDSNNSKQKINYLRKFLEYARSHFEYYDFNTPEDLLIGQLSKNYNSNTSLAPKDIFRKYAEDKLGASGAITSEQILTLQRERLSTIALDHTSMESTAAKVRSFLKFAPII